MGILFPEVRTTSVRLIWQPPAAPNGIILGKPAPAPEAWLQEVVNETNAVSARGTVGPGRVRSPKDP